MTGREIALQAARAADEKQAERIVVYDLRGLSDVADYFVLATVQSRAQARAVLREVEEVLRKEGARPMAREGSNDAQWQLLDYVDAVIHVFSAELREYYNLESLWGDAPKLDWNASENVRSNFKMRR
ncbi:MAG: ribosome silencing factor [Planctomycetota bacterium]|nr:ribosome silencing factor [Planctomycetota bacterium]